MAIKKEKRSSLKKLAVASVWTQPVVQSVITPAHSQTSCTIVAPNNCARLEGRGDIPNLDIGFFEFFIFAFFTPDTCSLDYSFVDLDAVLVFDQTTININNSFSVRHELFDQIASIDEVYEFSGQMVTLANGEFQINGVMNYQNNAEGRSNTQNVTIPLTCV